MTSIKKVLIIAPHIDDEMIGCWSVLKQAAGSFIDLKVLYMYELGTDRRQEAQMAARAMNFIPIFGEGCSVFNKSEDHPSGYDEIYVPSRRDWHADHQAVNRECRQVATHFYSVDMAHGVLLPDADTKLAMMNDCYRTQRKLWEKDDKYWLFEDIQTSDYDTYTKLTYGPVTVTALSEHATWIDREWSDCVRKKVGWHVPTREDINRLLAHCNGRVTIESTAWKVEA